ncbi:MAG: ATP-binding cassette domain-containing protein [Anaerolineales bacterium]|nr:ATP-binding cassette domain-containing protein [Anaerolineales bacterium]
MCRFGGDERFGQDYFSGYAERFPSRDRWRGVRQRGQPVRKLRHVPQRDIVHMELTPTMALDYAAQLRLPADTSLEERQAVVEQTLKDLGLWERKDIPISRLSGGQLKRVSIGVELLTRPRLFFLDEPTSGLDPGTEYEMMRLLRGLADQGRTIIIVTHTTKNVMLCDKVIILGTGGYLIFFGAPEDALAHFDAYRTPRERLEKRIKSQNPTLPQIIEMIRHEGIITV